MKKGIFRLGIVLSILAATVLPVALLEKQPWVTCTIVLEKSGETFKDDSFESIDTTYYEFKFDGEFGYDKHGKLWIMVSKGDLARIAFQIDAQGVPEESYQTGYYYYPDGTKTPRIFPLKRGKGFFPNSETEEMSLKHYDFFDRKDWQKDVWIEKIEGSYNWSRFFRIAVIGFCSVWVLYLMVRWVFIAYVIEGFKKKEVI